MPQETSLNHHEFWKSKGLPREHERNSKIEFAQLINIMLVHVSLFPYGPDVARPNSSSENSAPTIAIGITFMALMALYSLLGYL